MSSTTVVVVVALTDDDEEEASADDRSPISSSMLFTSPSKILFFAIGALDCCIRFLVILVVLLLAEFLLQIREQVVVARVSAGGHVVVVLAVTWPAVGQRKVAGCTVGWLESDVEDGIVAQGRFVGAVALIFFSFIGGISKPAGLGDLGLHVDLHHVFVFLLVAVDGDVFLFVSLFLGFDRHRPIHVPSFLLLLFLVTSFIFVCQGRFADLLDLSFLLIFCVLIVAVIAQPDVLGHGHSCVQFLLVLSLFVALEFAQVEAERDPLLLDLVSHTPPDLHRIVIRREGLFRLGLDLGLRVAVLQLGLLQLVKICFADFIDLLFGAIVVNVSVCGMSQSGDVGRELLRAAQVAVFEVIERHGEVVEGVFLPPLVLAQDVRSEPVGHQADERILALHGRPERFVVVLEVVELCEHILIAEMRERVLVRAAQLSSPAGSGVEVACRKESSFISHASSSSSILKAGLNGCRSGPVPTVPLRAGAKESINESGSEAKGLSAGEEAGEGERRGAGAREANGGRIPPGRLRYEMVEAEAPLPGPPNGEKRPRLSVNWAVISRMGDSSNPPTWPSAILPHLCCSPSLLDPLVLSGDESTPPPFGEALSSSVSLLRENIAFFIATVEPP
ncbi:uncharacterized protein ACA1_367240 [Acanthamoeba castellanii str. Neff]|uniref:Uncharacterized protein n=1 Tax=Acanthamoeba castellanii (strain ATCC 30010 / Neff) TaxID=1257118 RepID=L8GPR3_ACACF|nr:uncharacterized protein ACA1_367240 [Acanthamoeba castellanii str. Neff]ELR14091.1 hypothetical protein ACA1_367240 [Acanthamoeba castellanii str. Neff]